MYPKIILVLPKTCNPYTGDKKTYFRYSNPGDQRSRDAKTWRAISKFWANYAERTVFHLRNWVPRAHPECWGRTPPKSQLWRIL